MSQRILVTGARGFLGSHIVAQGRQEGLEVVATYRGAADVGTLPLDVCDAASVDRAFCTALPSIVIHCAAYGVNYADQDESRARAVNLDGALRVLAAAARCGVQRFVHVGSCFEYGSHAGPINEEAPLNPTALYGATKAAATLLLRERAQALNVPFIAARPFGMWGPSEAAHRLIPQVITACVNRTPLKLTPCEVVRDQTYVEDMAANILTLARIPHAETGILVNVGSGRGVVLRDFVVAIARLLGGEDLMQFGALSYRPTEMRSLVADVTRMRQLLGDRPETPVPEGIQRMVARAQR